MKGFLEVLTWVSDLEWAKVTADIEVGVVVAAVVRVLIKEGERDQKKKKIVKEVSL